MPCFVAFVGLMMASNTVVEADPITLPANAWSPIKPKIIQLSAADEQGRWTNAGWNKLVYDSIGKRVLFYDRWVDKRHGGTTIYGNCLFSFDPAIGTLVPLKIDNWMKQEAPKGGYRTVPLPEDDKEPTPCSRHVYHGFDYISESSSVFVCNGANQTAMLNDKLLGHQLCTDTWRFDLATTRWTKIVSNDHPPNRLEDGMAYCPDNKSIVYVGHGKIWMLDIDAGQWRKPKTDLPRDHMGMSVFYDAPRKRLLLAGGGAYGKWQTKAGGFNTLYAFDTVTEKITRLADCPTALCRAGMAHDTRRDLFFMAATLKGDGVQQPSGLFAYDPTTDAWREIKSSNPVPMVQGWMPLCYDSANDCLVGMAGTAFYLFRYAPAD